MTPGRALDALVAEKVMGIKDPATGWLADEFPDSKITAMWPHYSTDIKAAWEVRDCIVLKLFSVRQKFTESLRKLISEELECDPGIHHSEVILRVKPHHICLAALKAVGVEI